MFDIFRTAFLLLIIAFIPSVVIYLSIIGICKLKDAYKFFLKTEETATSLKNIKTT